ncbi:MAG: TonB-dependent receptor [Bacteroidales bacterium]|nr:TonB-dependent receptor [Bacteroidales bacterium]
MAAATLPDTVGASFSHDSIALGDVVVYGSHINFGPSSVQMSAITVGKAAINSTPVFMGEPDVMKTLQKFPGVVSSNDGTAGVFVRGGDYDQNLIVLDGSALYNVEHLKGFVSSINPDVVESINFYRGGFPARYGSRLSSIVDVGIRTGDFDHYHGGLSLGMMTGRVHVEGPLWKGRTSFNVAARMSYLGLIAMPVLRKVYDKPGSLSPFENMKYYDINVKLVHRFSNRHRLSGVFYYGHDDDTNSPSHSTRNYSTIGNRFVPHDKQTSQEQNRSNSMSNCWANMVSSLYWTAQFGDSFKLNTNLSFSRYIYDLAYDNHIDNTVTDHYRTYYFHTETSHRAYSNNVSDLALTTDGNLHLLGGHLLRAGASISFQRFSPGVSHSMATFTKCYNGSLNDNTGMVPSPMYIEKGDTVYNDAGNGIALKTASVYGEDEFRLFNALKLNAGIRLSVYGAVGKSYFSFEPRLGLSYLFNENMAIKLSYSRMSQGVHRLVSGNLVMASDLWVPITSEVPIMTSNMFGLGFCAELPLGMTLSVEGYYKTISNVLDYRDAATNMLDNEGDWAQQVALGKGKSYGIEFLASKSVGRTTGWISYTWSKSLRTFDKPGQEINGGKEFFAPTDRRHNFNATVTHTLRLSGAASLNLTAAFSFLSGRRGTIPLSYIFGFGIREFTGATAYADQIVRDTFSREFLEVFGTAWGNNTGAPLPMYTYKNRNDVVLPSTHHLDLSCTCVITSRFGESSVGLSLYNVYNRMNISNVYVGYENNKTVLKGICPFPFMPSIILSHKF